MGKYRIIGIRRKDDVFYRVQKRKWFFFWENEPMGSTDIKECKNYIEHQKWSDKIESKIYYDPKWGQCENLQYKSDMENVIRDIMKEGYKVEFKGVLSGRYGSRKEIRIEKYINGIKYYRDYHIYSDFNEDEDLTKTLIDLKGCFEYSLGIY